MLTTGEVEGVDPLAPFDDHVADDLLRLSRFDNAPDIYLNSMFDPETGEVAAFEELVGCHGGTGGWQTEPMLVHPADWPVDDERACSAPRRCTASWCAGSRRSATAPTCPGQRVRSDGISAPLRPR